MPGADGPGTFVCPRAGVALVRCGRQRPHPVDSITGSGRARFTTARAILASGSSGRRPGSFLPTAARRLTAARGGQPGQRTGGPSPSASTSVAVPSQTATPGTPSPGAPTPARPAHVLSSRLAYPWHWPNDVTAPGRVTHAAGVPPVPQLVQAPGVLCVVTGGDVMADKLSGFTAAAMPEDLGAPPARRLAAGAGRGGRPFR